MQDEPVQLQFDFEWRITLFVAVLMPLMIALGFWQLQRAAEKTALATAWDLRQAQAPSPVVELFDKIRSDLAYLPVEVRGQLLPDVYFLLDNRIHNGRFGYEVLALLQLENGAGSVLVNRGWIEGDSARMRLPDVPSVQGAVALTGHVYVSPNPPYLLAEQQFDEAWPKRIQAVEMDKLRVELADEAMAPLFPYPVRIDAGEAGALTVDWQFINASPQMHKGYAVQWFTMATVLLIIYILRCSNLWQWLTARTRSSENG